jgi:hypothetical protein
MSNFSQFFPAGSGGSGINSYVPFLVGTTDNDPQGYIVSTGVYTNPVDSSVWLKTGKPLTADGTYPNATTGGFQYQGSGTNYDDLYGQSGIVWNGTNFITINATNDTVIELDAAFVGTGNTWSYNGNGNDAPRGITFDGTHYYIGDTDLEVRKYTNSFGTAVSSFTATNVTDFKDLTYLNGSIYVQGGALTTPKVWIYNSAGTQTGNWTLNTPIDIAYGGIVNDGTNIWISARDSSSGSAIGKVFQLTTAGVLTGISFLTNPETNQPSFIAYIGGGFRVKNLNSVTYFLYEETYGDTTARTSAMGDGQPLFIKLK